MKLFLLAFSYLRNEEDAKDVVGKSLLKILEKGMESGIKNIVSYSFQVVRNEAIDVSAKSKKKRKTEEAVVSFLKTENIVSPIKRLALKKKFELPNITEKMKIILPPEQLEAILFWAHGYSYIDIADEMDKNETQIRGLIYRAKQNIKELKTWATNFE